MKNILARGGIEFLAVLLGISGSLWIDDWSNSRSDVSEEYSAYVRLSKAMEHDILNIEKELEKNNKMVDVINHLITNIENISADSLTLYIDQTQSYVTLMPQFSDYEALKSTGKLYKISDFDLLQKIIDLYDNKYGGPNILGGDFGIGEPFITNLGGDHTFLGKERGEVSSGESYTNAISEEDEEDELLYKRSSDLQSSHFKP